MRDLLSGWSDICGPSFEQLTETIESIVLGTLNLLEIRHTVNFSIRLHNAGSSECFGGTGNGMDETMPFCPNSLYAVAKTASHMFVKTIEMRVAYAPVWGSI